jgi:ATP synthase protein I
MKKNIKLLRRLFPLSTIGLILASCVGIGYFIGNYLDNKFKTFPYLMLILTLLGIVAGFREVFILIKKQMENDA